MTTNTELEKQLNDLKAEFSEFRQAVENTFFASGVGLGIEFGRQLCLLREKNAPAKTTEALPPLPATGSTVEEAAFLRATVMEMMAKAKATLPLLSLDQALRIAKGGVVSEPEIIPPPQPTPTVAS